jgi:hypothetical protein
VIRLAFHLGNGRRELSLILSSFVKIDFFLCSELFVRCVSLAYSDRCVDNATRLEFKVRPTEGGRAGELRAYVVAKIAPKTCQVWSCEKRIFTRTIMPLSMRL